MKGIVIKQKGYASATDKVHNYDEEFKRIIIPELNNLAITVHDDQIYVYSGFEMSDDCKVLKEIDVPTELAEHALQYKKAQDDFFSHRNSFENLL